MENIINYLYENNNLFINSNTDNKNMYKYKIKINKNVDCDNYFMNSLTNIIDQILDYNMKICIFVHSKTNRH